MMNNVFFTDCLSYLLVFACFVFLEHNYIFSYAFFARCLRGCTGKLWSLWERVGRATVLHEIFTRLMSCRDLILIYLCIYRMHACIGLRSCVVFRIFTHQKELISQSLPHDTGIVQYERPATTHVIHVMYTKPVNYSSSREVTKQHLFPFWSTGWLNHMDNQ